MHTHNQWQNRRVFITGSSGVIGKFVVEKLLEQNAHLFIADIVPAPLQWKGYLQEWNGNLNCFDFNNLESFAPETVIHLAATFERSEETEPFLHENFLHNISLSNHLLHHCLKISSLKQILFASSYLIYDPSQYLFSSPQTTPVPLTETTLQNPRNLCGMAKWLHEKELWFAQKFHPYLQCIAARIFRCYGPGSRDLLSRWVRALLNDQELTLYGEEGMFDYVYAEDVAEGMLRLANTSYSGVVNLGSGTSRKVNEIVDTLRSFFPSIHTKKISSPPLFHYEASQANMDLFTSLTGWNDFRSVEKGIESLIHYEKNYPNII